MSFLNNFLTTNFGEFDNIKSKAKKHIEGYIGLYCAADLIYVFVSCLYYGTTLGLAWLGWWYYLYFYSLDSVFPRISDVREFVDLFWILLIKPVFSMGFVLVFRGILCHNVHLSQLAEPFRIYFRVIVTSFLSNFIIFLHTLLLVIHGIMKDYSYTMAYYVLADNPEVSTWEVLKESERIMKGHRLEFFRMQCSFAGWFVLKIATLGIADIYVGPYYGVSKLLFYKKICGRI